MLKNSLARCFKNIIQVIYWQQVEKEEQNKWEKYGKKNSEVGKSLSKFTIFDARHQKTKVFKIIEMFNYFWSLSCLKNIYFTNNISILFVVLFL